MGMTDSWRDQMQSVVLELGQISLRTAEAVQCLSSQLDRLSQCLEQQGEFLQKTLQQQGQQIEEKIERQIEQQLELQSWQIQQQSKEIHQQVNQQVNQKIEQQIEQKIEQQIGQQISQQIDRQIQQQIMLQNQQNQQIQEQGQQLQQVLEQFCQRTLEQQGQYWEQQGQLLAQQNQHLQQQGQQIKQQEYQVFALCDVLQALVSQQTATHQAMTQLIDRWAIDLRSPAPVEALRTLSPWVNAGTTGVDGFVDGCTKGDRVDRLDNTQGTASVGNPTGSDSSVDFVNSGDSGADRGTSLAVPPTLWPISEPIAPPPFEGNPPLAPTPPYEDVSFATGYSVG
jgi:DNA polymerase III alpha subunit (gram-positive type)